MTREFSKHKQETLEICLKWLDYDDHNLEWRSPFWDQEFGPAKKKRLAMQESHRGYWIVRLRGEQFPAQRLAWALKTGDYPYEGRMVLSHPEYWQKGDTPMLWGHFHHELPKDRTQKGRKFVNWNARTLPTLVNALKLADQLIYREESRLKMLQGKRDQLKARHTYLKMQKEMGNALPLGMRPNDPNNIIFPAIRGKVPDFEEATGRKLSEFLDDNNPTLTPEVWQDAHNAEDMEPWGDD